MSQSPLHPTKLNTSHPYAEATAQLNKLVRLGQSFSGGERNCLYLNERDGHFANASAVGGIDEPEDGRCVVRCDWDRDGDLDLWVSNRTSPRLKFLRNEFANDEPAGNFVALKLVGTKSNRDAIGARVILQLASTGAGDGDKLTQSVRCGEGFLGQSSSWLHFGLGAKVDANSIKQLQVRWPTGSLEDFAPPATGGFYELVEGNGASAKPLSPLKRRPSATSAAIAEDGAHPNADQHALCNDPNAFHLLGQSVPLPPLKFTPFDGDAADATLGNGKPTLVNLWASWCSPCVSELTEWSEQSEEFDSEGLRVVALSVDDLDKADSRDETASRKLLKRIGFPHLAGMASPEFVEVLQLVNNVVYQHDHRALPIPSSFLIDGDGRLAAIYKGAVSVDRIRSDASTILELGSNNEKRMQAALPFPGRWIAKQGPFRVSKLAAALWESGFGPQSKALAERLGDDPVYRSERAKVHWENAMGMRSERKDLAGTAAQIQAVIDLSPNDTRALSELGILNAQQGNLPKAAELFARAVKHSNPPDANAHFNLAKSLFAMGKKEEGKKELLRVIEIDASKSQAYDLLGQLAAGDREFEKAAEQFSKAWRANPANVPSLLNLASALMEAGDNTRAFDELQTFLKRQPEDAAARVYLAQVLLEMDRIDDAIKELEKVVQGQPNASKAWLQLSQLETERGNWAKAVSHLKQVDKLVPDDPIIESELAWLYATIPDPAMRNGAMALEMAKRSAAATQRKDPRVLEILAAAYAENSDFEMAGEALQTAIELFQASSPANEKRIAALRLRLNAVRNSKPHRISAAGS